MSIGERISFFRKKRGMTQKELGSKIGFSTKTADIRLAQYESGVRTPKSDLTESIAYALNVSPMALNVPDIDTDLGLMHTLFALEDKKGFMIDTINGEVCIRLDKSKGLDYLHMLGRFLEWQKEAEKYRNGEITKEEYDHWRYTYPEVQTQRNKASLDKLRIKKE